MNASNLLAATLCSAALSAQANLYVDASTPVGTNDGLSWATAFRTIDAALTASAPGDEIWVASGTYTPRARLDPADPRSARYVVRRNVRLVGGFSGNETSIWQWPALPCTLSAEIGNATSNSDNLHHRVIAENDALGSSMRGFTFARANSIGAPTPMLLAPCSPSTTRSCSSATARSSATSPRTAAPSTSTRSAASR